MAPIESRHLIMSYRSAGEVLLDLSPALSTLTEQAQELLGRPRRQFALGEIGQSLMADAADVEERLHFLERTDRFDVAFDNTPAPLLDWNEGRAWAIPVETLARYLAEAENAEELAAIVAWMFRTDTFAVQHVTKWTSLPEELQPIFATSIAIAIEQGWWDDEIAPWLAASVIAHGNPSDDAFIALALHAFHNDRSLAPSINSANPFALPPEANAFDEAQRRLLANPALARGFISGLLDEHDRTGDTNLNRHWDSSEKTQLLADLVVVAGAGDRDIDARTAFVDRLVHTLNADDNTNTPVFWATWAVHAELAIEHGVATTAPTFGVHRLVPDAVRPHWEHAWNVHISPVVLQGIFGLVSTTQNTVSPFLHSGQVNETYAGQPADQGPGNDPGATFSARPKSMFLGLGWGASAVDSGRHIITHALRDASPEGAIASDEFAIIDHGIGADGRPTFTVNLPGVIDLATPVPGFDPVHFSVRDMDQVAIHSAPTTSTTDNLYAQMVMQGLVEAGVPPQSNLLLVGNSFGADTVLDLAASDRFTEQYHVSHVVAAAYDSVPQLADVDSDIEVLVLQNTSDQAIALEALHRWVGQGDESVSISTFTHDVRRFPGGLGGDLGHHPSRYIDYLTNTSDPELDHFLESVAATGYAKAGTTVAIDVSVEQTREPE